MYDLNCSSARCDEIFFIFISSSFYLSLAAAFIETNLNTRSSGGFSTGNVLYTFWKGQPRTTFVVAYNKSEKLHWCQQDSSSGCRSRRHARWPLSTYKRFHYLLNIIYWKTMKIALKATKIIFFNNDLLNITYWKTMKITLKWHYLMTSLLVDK